MNIKLHTPKSLKSGSGMSSMRQFMLSLLATTVSIILTFGTAAVLDNNKKQKEKREIVMMVMYDMHQTLKLIEKADSSLYLLMDYQRQIAEDTSKFAKMKYSMIVNVPNTEFTETTERIFSSNIESINTVGNVLFIENVAEFYQLRKLYKKQLCDTIHNEIAREKIFETLKGTLDFDYYYYSISSKLFLNDLQQLFAQCQQMMDVTDEQIEAYQKQRKNIEKSSADKSLTQESIINEVGQLRQRIEDARDKLKLE